MKRKMMMVSVLLLLGCTISRADLTAVEKKYLDELANYTGNLGIGFVPEHTFDYGFRQAILHSKDEDVQRAFILHRLPRELDRIISTLRSGKKMTGKGQYENLSEEDKKTLFARFEECMALMQKLDGGKNKHFYTEYRSKLDEGMSNKKE